MEDGFYLAVLDHVLVLLSMLLSSWSDFVRLYTFDPQRIVEHEVQCKSHRNFQCHLPHSII